MISGTATSYDELTAEVSRWNNRLESSVVSPGSVVALRANYSRDACAALVALADRKCIVVPLAVLPERKEKDYLDISRPEFIADIGGDGVSHISETGARGDHSLYRELRSRKEAGLVLFSSGTTGRSKASVLSLDKLLAKYSPTRRPRRTLAFMNLDHIGGVNTLFHTIVQGGAVITIDERTPDAVFKEIEASSVDTLPTTPTFLTMAVVSGAIERYDTSSLRLVTYGTEVMPAQTLTRARSSLPNVRFKQTYGLSELGIIPTRSKSDDSLWVELGTEGFEYKIVDDVLWVRAETAMLGYLNAPDPFDMEGYFNTQDKVAVDGPYVQILGRTTDIINVGGEKVYPSEVESVLLEQANIREAAVSGKASPVTGQVVTATVQLIEMEEHAGVERRLIAGCAAQLEPHKVPAQIIVTEAQQHTTRFKKIRGAR